MLSPISKSEPEAWAASYWAEYLTKIAKPIERRPSSQVWQKNQTLFLPSECELVSPHAFLQSSAESETKNASERMLPAELAQAAGTFMHHALHRIALGHNDWAGDWQRLVETPLVVLRMGKSLQWWRERYLECQAKIIATATHPTWQGWVSKAQKLRPEQGILYYSEGRLLREQIDLYLEFPKEILLIDYIESSAKSKY